MGVLKEKQRFYQISPQPFWRSKNHRTYSTRYRFSPASIKHVIRYPMTSSGDPYRHLVTVDHFSFHTVDRTEVYSSYQNMSFFHSQERVITTVNTYQRNHATNNNGKHRTFGQGPDTLCNVRMRETSPSPCSPKFPFSCLDFLNLLRG